MKRTCIAIAENMLGKGYLPANLYGSLIRADQLCRNVGVELHSRQAIAVIVDAYNRDCHIGLPETYQDED